MNSRSTATSPYDGSARRSVEYTCSESCASRTRFSEPTGGGVILTESPAHQLPLHGFGEVRDSRSQGQLLKGSTLDMTDDYSSKREDHGDRKGEASHR